VDQNGKVSAVSSTGSAKITVSSKEDGSKKAECTVTVGGVTVTGVTLDKTSLTLAKGGQETLTATLLGSGASALTWISSNPDVAAVPDGSTGSQVTVTGKSGGNATITVSTVNGGYTASCVVTVNIPVDSVSLDHTKIMLRSSSGSSIISKASMAQLSATVLPADATNKQVTWASDNPNIATVSASGMVTGKAVGNATITVTTADGGFKDTCDVTVYGHFTVNNASAWTNALTSISNASDGSADRTNVFVVEIRSNVSVAGSVNDSSITGDYKEVRLTGGSGTPSLESKNGGSLIWTAANQTFIIDGPTLQGISGSSIPIVVIQDGAVELHSGCITGNVSGGGVVVYNGNFTMTGGEISGNTAYMGGGVAVNGGNFEMTGDFIYGQDDPDRSNNASSGAAVYNASGNSSDTTITHYP
jgi:uncharacterized protein YjdB